MTRKIRNLWIIAALSGTVWAESALSATVPATPAAIPPTITHVHVLVLPRPHSGRFLSLHAAAYSAGDGAKRDMGLPVGWKIVGNPVAALRAEGLVSGSVRGVVPGARDTSMATAPASGALPDTLSPAGPVAKEGETGLWLPLGELTSVAAFRSGEKVTLIADGRHPLDTSLIPQDGPVRVTSVDVMQSITVVTLSVPNVPDPVIVPSGDGWSVKIAGNGSSVEDITAAEHADNVSFALPQGQTPSRVVVLRDPHSGRRLLLGLSRQGRIRAGALFHGAGFAVRPSIVGLVVAADSDDIELRIAQSAYVLDALEGGKAQPLFRTGRPTPSDDGAGVVLSSLPLDELRENYRQAWTEAALAPPGRRFEARIRAARMAAILGNRADLEGALTLALRDRPEGASRADVERLAQIEAVLHRKLPEGDLPDTVGNTPEDQFWRGSVRLLDRTLDGEQERLKTARLLAAGLHRAEGYAAPLRAQVLPQAAAFVARNAPKDQLAGLDGCDRVDEERLACALRASRLGAGDASARLDRLVTDADPVVSEGAREERVVRDLAGGKKTAAQAADALDVLIPAARFVGREREIRLLEMNAALKAGQPARVRTLLDEWARLFPDRRDDVAPMARELAHQIEAMPDAKAAFERLSFLRKNLERASDSGERVALMRAISAQFETLGLFRQARDSLAPALETAKGGERADLQLRLARLDLRGGNVTTVFQDLQGVSRQAAATEVGLSGGQGGVWQEAALVRAQAFVSQKKYGPAKAALDGVNDRRATLLLVDIAEQQNDWLQAASKLQELIDAPQNASDGDDLRRRYVMRMAEDASRAGDETLKQQFRTRYGRLMAQGAQGRIFDLLTAAKAPGGGGVAGG